MYYLKCTWHGREAFFFFFKLIDSSVAGDPEVYAPNRSCIKFMSSFIIL